MFKRGFVSLYVRAAVSSAISLLCSVTDGAFLPWSASSGLKRFVSLCVRTAVSSAISPLCSGADGALLPRAASSGLNAACVVMCPGGSQQRDFAALFRYRRCASALGGVFRFKRGLGRYMSERLLHFCRLRMPLTRRSCCLRPFADPWPTFWPQCRPNLQAK